MNYKTQATDFAFPQHEFGDAYGLTKREHFAAMAMQGLFANPKYIEALAELKNADPSKHIAGTAVILADALIKALNGDH